MTNLSDYLKEKQVSVGLNSVVEDLSDVFVQIQNSFSYSKRKNLEGNAGSENVTGDDQVKMDVYANDLFVDRLGNNSNVALIASEEIEESIKSEFEGDGYSVVLDPLDGSSIVDMNMSVGTIVGIYEGDEVVGKKGRQQVASIIAVYGEGLTFLITFGDGVDEFIYDDVKNEFVLWHSQLKMDEKGKIMGPGNTKIVDSDPWYFKFIMELAKSGYSVRYSGGMVPDVNQIIKKGGGIYMYPGSKEKPDGKLRLVFECAPMAFLVEQAGGKAISTDLDILDIEIKEYHQRTAIFLGSSNEVERAKVLISK